MLIIKKIALRNVTNNRMQWFAGLLKMYLDTVKRQDI